MMATCTPELKKCSASVPGNHHNQANGYVEFSTLLHIQQQFETESHTSTVHNGSENLTLYIWSNNRINVAVCILFEKP